MTDGTIGGGATMDQTLHQVILMTGKLQGSVEGLKSAIDTLSEQQSDKADKDAKFRHHVYNELAEQRGIRDDMQRLSSQVTDMSRQIAVANQAHSLAQSAHSRIDGMDARLRPIETQSMVRKVLRSGMVQLIAAGTAVVGAAISVAQALQGHQ